MAEAEKTTAEKIAELVAKMSPETQRDFYLMGYGVAAATAAAKFREIINLAAAAG